MLLCAIWYHFYNLKNEKNIHRGVLLLVNQHATLLKVTLPHEWFSYFLNSTNGTKSHKASHICFHGQNGSVNLLNYPTYPM